MNKEGLLVVLSAPSGCGKDTVFQALSSVRGDVVESVSATTRKPRPGEVNGVDYFFKTEEEFKKMIRQDQLLEYACYNGSYYGTPAEGVTRAVSQGKICFLIIEVQGAKKIKERYPQCVSVFLIPPDPDTLERRLRGRLSDDASAIENRLKIARAEMKEAHTYDYIVMNDELQACVQEINQILCKELAKRNA